MKNKNTLGIILILLGIFFLITGFLSIPKASFVLTIIGTIFLTFYFGIGGNTYYFRTLPFIIPGSVCLSIGIALFFSSIINIFNLEGLFITFFIGTAFLFIYLVHTYNSKNTFLRIWPLFPMAGLYFATTMIAINSFPFENMIPISLIIIGIILIISNRKNTDSQYSKLDEEFEIDDIPKNKVSENTNKRIPN